MTDTEKNELLASYSRAEISATALRRALGGITYGDVLIGLAALELPLPRTPQAGSSERIAKARAVLFPRVS